MIFLLNGSSPTEFLAAKMRMKCDVRVTRAVYILDASFGFCGLRTTKDKPEIPKAFTVSG